MLKKFKWIVSSKENGIRLVLFIKQKTKTDLSNREIKNALEQGLCKVNEKVETFASWKLKEGDSVKLERALSKKRSILQAPKVLYEDDYLLIIDKPSGLLSLDEQMHKFFPKSYLLVHRLDKATSGVLVVAKSLEIKNRMISLFSSKQVKKTYIAVVDGELNKKEGTIESFLTKKNKTADGKVIYYSTRRKGRYAETKFTRLKKTKKYSVVKCMPITGRTHQIRVHMLDLKHPILGDYQYASHFIYQPFVDRLMLHSLQIEFIHPILEKKIIVRASFPICFKKFIKT